MRYLEQLIDRARELSQNTRYDANSGISQKMFVQYFQNAQDFITREIVTQKSKYLLKKSIIPVVNGQEEYDYPSDIILQGIDTVEWSQDQRSWVFLEKNISKDRFTSTTGYPFGYVTNRNKIVVTPSMAYGYLRITYNGKPKRLESRSALVASTTGTPITAITVNTAFADQDMSYINQFDSITVVSKAGVVKVENMPITSASSATIVVPSYALASGEAIAAGDYILAGGLACNVPQFDDLVESFLILHATYQAKYGDSSQWSKEVSADVGSHFKQLSDCFGTLSDDFNHIPILNADYLNMW
jgi:hypothetical protein